MKNLLKLLSLLLTLLLTLTHHTESESDVIVKNSHRIRITVIEYNKDGETNTKVVISPPWKKDEDEKVVLIKRNVKKKVREKTTSSLQNNSICQGKYKHKIMSSMLKRFKDQTMEMARDLPDQARDVEENVWERVKSVVLLCIGKITVFSGPAMKLIKEEMKLTKFGSVIGLMGISAAYGTCVWVAFVSSYVLDLVLGKHQYGVVKTRLYPVYFKAISVWIFVGLLGHILSQKKKVLKDPVVMWQAVNLLSCLFVVEANASFVESRATKVKFEVMKVEKEVRRGCWRCNEKDKKRLMEMRKSLRNLNVYSSCLNALTLFSLTWHFVFLGQRLSAIS